MQTPFKNDPFSLVWQAFKNLYPDKDCVCFWETQIREDDDGRVPCGLTDFGEDGSVAVFVNAELAITDATEILAHELAHVAVGVSHDHEEEWQKAFNDIFVEYNRIGDAMVCESEED